MRPIQWAARRGNTKIFEFVLSCNEDDKQAQCSCQLPGTFSQPVHLVAYNGNIEILEILLANGAELLAKNNWSDTCLHIAIRQNKIEFARWVIEFLANKKMKAADVDIESTMDHFTPYMVAVIHE